MRARIGRTPRRKFFTQSDTTFTDGVQLMLLLAVLYTIVQALKLANGVS
jgi:hypothetical protein